MAVNDDQFYAIHYGRVDQFMYQSGCAAGTKLKLPHNRSYGLTALEHIFSKKNDLVVTGYSMERADFIGAHIRSIKEKTAGVFHQVTVDTGETIQCMEGQRFLLDDFQTWIPAVDLQQGMKLAAMHYQINPDLPYIERYVRHTVTVANNEAIPLNYSASAYIVRLEEKVAMLIEVSNHVSVVSSSDHR